MINRSIFRSNKNVGGENEGKRVQVQLTKNHLLVSPRASSDKENSQCCKRELSIQASRLKVDPPPPKGSSLKNQEGKGGSLHKSCTSIKGCLKRELEERKESLPESDQAAKSSKSIKFNIHPSDVFEYTHQGQGQVESKKRVKPPSKKKVGSNTTLPLVPAQQVEGECCQIF